MDGLYYEEYVRRQRLTPESFRRLDKPTEHTEEGDCKKIQTPDRSRNETPQVDQQRKADEDMANPYMDRGYTMPYQISQNKYREQVFGNRPGYNYYNQPKPEPLAGRDIPPNNRPRTPPQRAEREGRPDGYNERRGEPYYEQRTYRSGRPDIGYENPGVSVPYPQEPLRKRSQYDDYMRPPDIGFDPYKEPSPRPKSFESGSENAREGHPGWILLMRFSKDGLPQVIRALTMCVKHIEGDGGRIMGIARSYGIRIREGGDSWVKFGHLRAFPGGQWDIQHAPTHEDTHYCVLAIYYPSLTRASEWFNRDINFKQRDFPAPYNMDTIALPLSSSVDTPYNKTLVLTEYPRISHPEYFRDKFSSPTEDMMRQRFRASPYVVKASSVPTDDLRMRVARHLRGCWIQRNSVITLSMFESEQEAKRYFADPEYSKCKESQDRVSAPTTVVMDLEDWREPFSPRRW